MRLLGLSHCVDVCKIIWIPLTARFCAGLLRRMCKIMNFNRAFSCWAFSSAALFFSTSCNYQVLLLACHLLNWPWREQEQKEKWNFKTKQISSNSNAHWAKQIPQNFGSIGALHGNEDSIFFQALTAHFAVLAACWYIKSQHTDPRSASLSEKQSKKKTFNTEQLRAKEQGHFLPCKIKRERWEIYDTTVFCALLRILLHASSKGFCLRILWVRYAQKQNRALK